MKPDLAKIKQQKTIKQLLEFSIINIDKPSGPTSFRVDEIIKKKLGLRKTSHFGTLDPKVTGVLPVALNRACRLMNYFIGRNKEYVGIMRLHKEIDEKKLRKEVKKFIGKIKQKPPVRSRVRRETREREVYGFDILEIDGKDVLFKTEVQAGTYIRKLISDMGQNIGGAHMIELRRTKASIFDEKNSVDIYKFLKAVDDYEKGDEKKLREILIPGEIVSEVLPVVKVKKEAVKQLLTGKPVFKDDLIDNKKINKLAKDNKVAIFCGQQFIGVYRISEEKDIIARPEFVLN